MTEDKAREWLTSESKDEDESALKASVKEMLKLAFVKGAQAREQMGNPKCLDA